MYVINSINIINIINMINTKMATGTTTTQQK